VLTNKLTNKQMPLKTSTSFRYATPVGNKLWPLVSVIFVTLFVFQEKYMNSIYCTFSFGIISVSVRLILQFYFSRLKIIALHMVISNTGCHIVVQANRLTENRHQQVWLFARP